MDSSAANGHDARFRHQGYTIRTKLLRLFGGAYHIYDNRGGLVLYSDMKRFRLKEDIRLYSDESKTAELLRINTQSVLDFSGAYDVQDSVTGERVGTLKRGGLSSTFVRDSWTFLDARGREIGTLEEDSALKGLVRRYIEALAIFLPQRYHASIGGREVARYSQRFNPLILKLDVDFSPDSNGQLDRRLGIAAGVLLSAVEGRQQ